MFFSEVSVFVRVWWEGKQVIDPGPNQSFFKSFQFLLKDEALQFGQKNSKNSDVRKLNLFVSDFFQICWIRLGWSSFAEFCWSLQTDKHLRQAMKYIIHLDSILFHKAQATQNQAWEWKLLSNSKSIQLWYLKCPSLLKLFKALRKHKPCWNTDYP